MKIAHRFEALLASGLIAGFRAMPWKTSLAAGAAMGDTAWRAGLRRKVAEENLARAFPEWSEERRATVLREHYRELGRVFAEYARLPELAHAPPGEVIAEIRNREILDQAHRGGGPVILMSGHFGNIELLGAALSRIHPVDFVVRPLSNPAVDRKIQRLRGAAGVGSIDASRGLRGVYRALDAGHWVAFLADQDARSHGVFVPFLGRPASTPVGPARLALATGAPVILGFTTRLPDGRHDLEIEPPLAVPDRKDLDAVERLTALHTARLEAWVRKRPELWLWLHRRWKTAPPTSAAGAAPQIERTGDLHASL